MQFKFSHYICAMCFRSFYTDSQRHGHFFAALPFRQQLNYLALARSEAVANYGVGIRGGGMRTNKSVEQHVGRTCSKKRPMIGERLDSSDQITVSVGFHDVGAHASLDDFANQLVGKMKRKDQDFRFWKTLANLSSSFQSI